MVEEEVALTRKAGMSIRQYAAYRKEKGLPGGSRPAVEKALRDGRIKRSPDGKIHPAYADKQWIRNTDLAMQRGGTAAKTQAAEPSSTKSYADARARREELRVRSEELAILEREGKLVAVDRVRLDYFKLARRLRDAILAVPARIAAELLAIAQEEDERLIELRIEAELREVLNELADDGSS